MWLGGEPVAAQTDAWFDVLAPADGTVLAQVPRAGREDVDAAVTVARQGFFTWSGQAPAAREAVLLKAAELMAGEGGARFLDTLIDESGSVIAKARNEIRYSVDLLRTAAGECRRLYGDTFPNDNPERLSMVFREPLGVVGVVSPYNAPLSLLVKMTAFPLAAGNAVVIKPSEETPLTALAFGQLLLDAGLPPQALSVLTGFGGECGAPLSGHPGLDCIALTGSTHTGIAVGKAAMEHMRRCQLELGGKSALLVLADADPEEAAAIAADGIFTHAGQICMANSRIVVEAPVFRDFTAALVRRAEALHLGDLRDENSRYGPLINRAALDKALAQVADAVARGATLLTGGEALHGLTMKPTVVEAPPLDCALWREETFAPVVSVVSAENLDEAIELANDSAYGLSAAVLTHHLQRGLAAARRLRSGAVHIGMHAFQSNALAPIGGLGLSGLGRSGGRYSTEEFTELKWISVEAPA
ncbi:aldehyde dehydrogenase family protein [Parahaliea maris]|uniref:Aldehyde dehydrogenase family protein n=2 Tax=Parahaliea maris TaxID=2716870 RepID=A0A5C9A9L3_9GAMM|nr:aldehyde dehydrogenase family protein [Parahaliea maris]